MSNALTGQAAQLGQELKEGAQVYFNQLNNQKGIHGRQVDLISMDDGYEPINTVANTHNLIAQQVFALFGYVGTPTSHAILSILDKKNIPYLMPLTGADFLRKPIVDNIFNLRPSYQQEAEVQVDYLVKVKKFTKVALAIQADEFGLTAEKLFNKVLNKHKLKPVITTRFRRNSQDITKVLTKLKHKPIEAVVFIGTHPAFTRLINLGYTQGFNPFYSSLSFISSKDVYSELNYPSRVLVSEVLPEPSQCKWKVCLEFIKDMKKAGFTDFTRIQLEGYLNAYLFSQVANRCGKELTRQCLIEKFEQYSMQQEGLHINFSPNNHQGLQQVYLSFSEAAK